MKYMNFILPKSQAYNGLTLKVNGKEIPVEEHTKSSLNTVMKSNKAMAMMSENTLSQINYFAKLDAEDIPPNRLSRIQITSKDDEFNLPILHHFSFHISEKHRLLYWQNKLKENSELAHPKLQLFEINQPNFLSKNSMDLQQIMSDLDLVLSPFDIAKSLLFQHPNLANTQPYTAAIVMNDHIAPSMDVNPEQYNRICEFATQISAQGPDKWAYRTYSMNQRTNQPLEYEYDVLGHKKGDKVEMYAISKETLNAAGSPLSAALNSSNQDNKLQNQTWQVNQGKTADKVDDETIIKQRELRSSLQKATDSEGIKWIIKEETPKNGLKVFEDSLEYRSNNKFSIEVQNTYLRTLSAYVQFLDDAGKPLDNMKNPICIVGACDTVMGIPIPVWKKSLEFDFNKDASAAKLFFGGIGTSHIDMSVDLMGGILTGIFQYGIPSFFMFAGAGMASNKFYIEYLEDMNVAFEIVRAFLEVAQIGSHVSEPTEWISELLELMVKTIGGLIVKKCFGEILAHIIAEITVQEVAEAMPFAGWILTIANVVMDAAQLTITTAEVLSSPATLSIVITRAMNLAVTVHPDPEHGEKGKPSTAVWPAVGENWQITLTYKGGTSQVRTGKLSETTSNTPIEICFEDVPVGGKLKITTGVYSKEGWLCGKWESEWQDAFPEASSDTKAMDGSITEILVPLTKDVQYNYKEKIIYDKVTQEYKLIASDKPTATIKELSNGGLGNNLSQLINITYNSVYKQIGYTWSASGDNLPPIEGDKRISIEFMVQNLSILSDTEINNRYKAGEIGFGIQPYIAYDKFGNGEDNYILDTRKNQCHLRKVNLHDDKHNFGLTDENLLSWGRFNQEHLDAMLIHPNGFAVAVNWETSKMEIIEIPAEPSEDKLAQVAQMVAGEGIRQGLLHGPIALKVAPDGRVLVLESSNRRIQGFDTYGNPVPSFTGEKLFAVNTAEYISSLNAGQFSEQLQQVFNDNNLTYLFNMNAKFVTYFNNCNLSEEIITVFADHGVYLCYDKDNMDNHQDSSYIEVVESGNAWTVVDPGRNYSYNVMLNENVLLVYDVINEVVVNVEEQNKKWIVQDLKGAKSYLAIVMEDDKDKIHFYEYLSYLFLYSPRNNLDTYLDFSVEAKGYIYVLSYQNAGEQESDYFMDIYNPDGSFLVRTPDERLQPEKPQYLNAARFEVDEFRNVHTLNYEKMQGKQGYTEPTISEWIPTPPIFELDKDKLIDFQQKNMGKIKQDFSDKKVNLSERAQLITVTENVDYVISDFQTIEGVDRKITYDVLVSMKTLPVYKRLN